MRNKEKSGTGMTEKDANKRFRECGYKEDKSSRTDNFRLYKKTMCTHKLEIGVSGSWCDGYVTAKLDGERCGMTAEEIAAVYQALKEMGALQE